MKKLNNIEEMIGEKIEECNEKSIINYMEKLFDTKIRVMRGGYCYTQEYSVGRINLVLDKFDVVEKITRG